ncbi:nuclear transport factor 2 family protein [Aeromicrobium sp. Leaf350]|uniref:nuclear transport factor 2 family protein n=1 Tax=Aeromicrobium sp. Leaf350 TaxID=2876565 RepID=UPI001E3DFBE7|nr:nuclear transport factor 2 family protein [Aeromicrobium sp. Leaf350]
MTDLQTLPAVVTSYLDARDAKDVDGAVAAFTPAARVADDGGTHVGTDQIRAWIEESSTTFEYTTTRLGHQVDDAGHVVVQVRIDGNFPGGTATLHQRFGLDHDLITELVIAP